MPKITKLQPSLPVSTTLSSPFRHSLRTFRLLVKLLAYTAHGSSHSLIGTFVRSRRALAQYAYWLWWAVGINIALDVWNLVTIYRSNKDDLVKDCVNGSTDQNVIDTCNKTVDSTWWRVVVVASMVLGLAIQCCKSGCHPLSSSATFCH